MAVVVVMVAAAAEVVIVNDVQRRYQFSVVLPPLS